MQLKKIPIYLKTAPRYAYHAIKGKYRNLPRYEAAREPRVALCFYGLVGGIKGRSCENPIGSKEVLRLGHKHFMEHVIGKNPKVDVFIHTWSTDLKAEMKKLYKPKMAVFQKQIKFKIPDYVPGTPLIKQSQYSRWCSTKRVLELKSSYERQKGFTYDLVMLVRFDLAVAEDFVFRRFDPQYFYAANLYNEKPFLGFIYGYVGYPYTGDKMGLADLWLLGNSKDMDKMKLLYGRISEYMKPGRCALETYTIPTISNHLLLTYHLTQTGLIKKLKFALSCLGARDSTPLIRKKYFGYSLV